eukprot:TRINITY_DN9388_c0_g1_i3.p1 TRINITY_DN9388_c0_g1~~TRINITY_DN9388_c0_g1_i3.p1  ORF type:complete len:176 (-),score=15.66 TRINITY_DN9388_c0_g1_i3:52-579(-)
MDQLSISVDTKEMFTYQQNLLKFLFGWDDRIEVIRYGEYLKDGQGHGISHSVEGTYIGEWQHYLPQTGKMIWLDGYEYEGEWVYGRPIDWENRIHPKIIECIERRECTRQVSNEDHLLPQILVRCRDCRESFCKVCVDNGCHYCPLNKENRRWKDWKHCQCQREECRGSKKRRLE